MTKEVRNAEPLRMNSFPFQVTERSWSSDSSGTFDHEAPSALVTIVPDSPTATKRDPFHAMSCRSCAVPEERAAHAAPSALVRIAPFSPTAAKSFPFHARRESVEGDPIAFFAQKTPSGL